MEVWILRGTDPETLEEKINKQLEEVEKVKSPFWICQKSKGY